MQSTTLAQQVQILGILNLTPDSFFDGSRYLDFNQAIKQADRLVEEGADYIDIGGESSRPGAPSVTEDEEKQRILPVLAEIRKRHPHIKISIDTTKTSVLEAAMQYKIDMINDISAGKFDSKMFQFVAESGLSYVLMHMQGEPQTMQVNPDYNNVIEEIDLFFQKKIEELMQKGVQKEKICLDPGIGFGKRIEDNYKILAKLPSFLHFDLPIFIGVSMKSLLGGDVENRLPGSLALNLMAVLNGASYLRVHHVKETRLALEALAKTREQQ